VPYAAVMTVMEILLAAMWWWAGHEGLLDDEGMAGRRVAIARTIGLGVVMVTSIPVAFVRPDIAKYLWILLLVSSRVAARLAGQRPARPARTRSADAELDDAAP
jgi:hypothetical protein